MKLQFSAVLAATILMALTACGAGEQASDTASPSVSASASPKATAKPVPDVVGKTYIEARALLNKSDYYARLVGKDGKNWTTNIVPDASVMAVSTNPAAGKTSKDGYVHIMVNMTEAEFIAAGKVKAEAAKVAAEEAKIATRYTFTCGSYSSTQPTYKSYKEVWASPDYTWGSTCSVKIGGSHPSDKPTLLPSEQKLVDFVASKGANVSGPGYTVGNIMNLCAKVDTTYADQESTPARKAEAEAALTVCPDAPHAALLQETVTATKMGDGDKVVGQTMEPGTWKTKPGTKDCYWSRNTGGGDIIANDFVGFAPNGVTVTVYPGEGFESSRCGIWTKIG
ncbi:PASTA domain-containing protein [Pseudarthrobacter sp. SSS035]|uniref:PASTA domain-containing protein n=1 Tax=Pseudarthrobacter sp. SSS035 TaxID=2931399 RepID=UPI00200BDB63|nr:PASTA domain-containing protein [Pseudarthrobacter sp. SSS035]